MSNKKVRIFADARFKPKSDTLKNWESENPILLSGEPGVVVGLNEAGDGLMNETERIKFGDGVTPWNDLPWWKGPQGPMGPKGDGIGRTTAEGGEIFNDYENNKARTPFSSSKGSNNISGGKGFKILSMLKDDTLTAVGRSKCKMQLSTVEGLQVKDVVSANIGNNYTDFAKIVDINEADNLVCLNAYPVECTFTEGAAVLWVSQKQDIGDTPIGENQSSEGVDNITIQEAGHSEGRGNISGGKYSHTENRGNYAGYAAHAQNLNTKAIANGSSSGGSRTEAHGPYSDVGGEDGKTMAYATFGRGLATTAGTNAFEIKDIAFEELADNEEEEILGAVDTYYAATNGTDDANGKSEDAPVSTVARAVELANIAGYTAGDVITVKLIGESVSIGNLPVYSFNLVIESLDKKTTAEVSNPRLIANNKGALTIYKNVKIHIAAQYSSLNLADSNVKFDSNCEFSGFFPTLVFGPNSGGAESADGQSVVIECKTPSYISFSNLTYASRVYTKDVNLTIDDKDASTTVLFNAYYNSKPNGSTTYQKNVNLNFKNIKSVSFGNLEQAVFDGALQIINSSACVITPDTVDVSAPKWIITNHSGCEDVLSFTAEAGKYKVKEGYTVIAYNAIGDAIVPIDNILDLSEDSGEYTIDAREEITYEGTISLSSVEGLENGMQISIKSITNQDFILNAGSITAVDTQNDTIKVMGYPSQINRFLSAGKKYLFILADCTLGDCVLGDCGSANGIRTKTIGKGAHTDGEGTIATVDFQYVCGTYNANKPNTIFELGCGTSDADRRNVFEVYKDGTIGIYGTKITRDRLRKLLELID